MANTPMTRGNRRLAGRTLASVRSRRSYLAKKKGVPPDDPE